MPPSGVALLLALDRAHSTGDSAHSDCTCTTERQEVAMTKIVGNHDGPGGRNESYKIGVRKNVPRRTAVKEVKQGQHPGAHVVKINGREYVRDNPDSSTKDNVNRDK